MAVNDYINMREFLLLWSVKSVIGVHVNSIYLVQCCRVIMNFQTLEIDNTERDAESGPELSGLTFELQIE